MKYLKKYFYLAFIAFSCPLLAFAGQVNVNTADAETLSSELQGVGLSKALAIVEYRQAHGPFKSAQDLQAVKGIGARTVEINQDNILLQGQPAKPPK